MKITLEMISNIPAGREMDALIAEHVIGINAKWIVLGPESEERDWGSMGVQLTAPIEQYSRCMGSAWGVVEHMKKRGAEGTCGPIWNNFWQSGYIHIWELDAEEASLNICRAALAAVVVTVPTYEEVFAKIAEIYQRNAA